MCDCKIKRRPKRLRIGMVIHLDNVKDRPALMYVGKLDFADAARVSFHSPYKIYPGWQFLPLDEIPGSSQPKYALIREPFRSRFPYDRVHIPD